MAIKDKVTKQEAKKEEKKRHKKEIDKLKQNFSSIDVEFSKDKDAIDALLLVCKNLIREVILLKAENRSLSSIVEKIKG